MSPGARKIFWEDPYCDRIQTRISALDGDQVRLAETNFYALSGGQESDAGTIGGHVVQQAERLPLDIVYTLAPGHGLGQGDAVEVCIDWERRYRLMRLHFAAEVILNLVYCMLPTIKKIGAHIGVDKARIDFALEENISQYFEALSRQAEAIVTRDHAIVSAYSDVANERRFWEIPEFARVPCGGTHLRRTSEIGVIALKRKNTGRGKERIEITVDSRVAAPSSSELERVRVDSVATFDR